VLNVCLICSPLLIVKVIFVITVFFLFLVCVSTILVNKDDQKENKNTVTTKTALTRNLGSNVERINIIKASNLSRLDDK